MIDTYYLPERSLGLKTYRFEGPYKINWKNVQVLEGVTIPDPYVRDLNAYLERAEKVVDDRTINIKPKDRDVMVDEEAMAIEQPELHKVADFTVKSLSEWVLGSCSLNEFRPDMEMFLNKIKIKFIDEGGFLGRWLSWGVILINHKAIDVAVHNFREIFPNVEVTKEQFIAVVSGHEFGHSIHNAGRILGEGVSPAYFHSLPKNYPVKFESRWDMHRPIHQEERFAHSFAALVSRQQELPATIFDFISKYRSTLYSQALANNHGITRVSKVLNKIITDRPELIETHLAENLLDVLLSTSQFSYAYPLSPEEIVQAVNQKCQPFSPDQQRMIDQIKQTLDSINALENQRQADFRNDDE